MPLPSTMVNSLRQVATKRFNADQLRNILFSEKKSQALPTKEKYVTGIHHGNFFRIKIPTKKSIRKIPRLHTPLSAPMPLKHVSRGAEDNSSSSWWDMLHRWLKNNAAILILNFGSICSMIGFTRSDVLELRMLSVSGSLCAVTYHVFTPPLRWTPIAWSVMFAAVNSFKIFEIIQEREGSVNLSAEQEQRYTDFFMQHGITPKQFEAIDGRAKILQVKKNQVIVRQGDVLQHVYLIVKGQTRASVLGRFLTAASFRPVDKSKQKPHPNREAGAWIGEMALLEHVWHDEVKHSPKRNLTGHRFDQQNLAEDQATPEQSEKKTELIDANRTTKRNSLVDGTTKETEQPAVKAAPVSDAAKEHSNARAMYTIVAQDDCTVLVWSHAELKALMAKSPDMKAALTRAMTAAIVGKVVTFTTSRSSGINPMWLSSWLSESEPEFESLATTMQVEASKQTGQVDTDSLEEIEDAIVSDPIDSLPRYPVRKFK